MPVQLGVIGFGGMAGWHCQNITRVPGARVIGAYDIDPERVQKAMEQGYKGYQTLEALLADEEINTVLVATPNDVHCELAIAASRAGKHVVCEKPAALRVDELDRMIEAAEKAGKLFTVHQNRRWDKDYMTAREVVQKGMLGNVFTIQSRLHGSGGIFHGWREFKKHGGGMIFDWGVHFLDQVMDMLGYTGYKSVYCVTSGVFNREVDDYFNLVIDMQNGTRVMVEIGTFMLHSLPRWFICGDEGTCYIHNFSAEGQIVSVKELQDELEIIASTPNGPTRTFAPRPDNTKVFRELPPVSGDWTMFYQNLNEAIDHGSELIVKPWQVRKVLALMEACFESAETGKVVDLSAL